MYHPKRNFGFLIKYILIYICIYTILVNGQHGDLSRFSHDCVCAKSRICRNRQYRTSIACMLYKLNDQDLSLCIYYHIFTKTSPQSPNELFRSVHQSIQLPCKLNYPTHDKVLFILHYAVKDIIASVRLEFTFILVLIFFLIFNSIKFDAWTDLWAKSRNFPACLFHVLWHTPFTLFTLWQLYSLICCTS